MGNRKGMAKNLPPIHPCEILRTKGLSCVGGASTRTTLYRASQFGPLKLISVAMGYDLSAGAQASLAEPLSAGIVFEHQELAILGRRSISGLPKNRAL